MHTARNMYIDTILIDTFGKVFIYDTVQFNKLGRRGILKNYTIPVIIKYIPTPIPPQGQLYVGGGLDGTYINKQVNLNMVEAGLMYKNKKDQMYGAKAMLDFKGNLYYGIQSYWKIKLK